MRSSGLKNEVENVLLSKKIWPYPSSTDGPDSGLSDRLAICNNDGYIPWSSASKSLKNAKWLLLNGEIKSKENYHVIIHIENNTSVGMVTQRHNCDVRK